jgi:outer membrane receptor protein involved in Fe transport
MAKTYLLLFFIIIALPNQLFSQINISGQIVNQNNKPVELIEIQLQNKDSVLVKSELTNTEGKFTISIEKGEYLLFVKQLGTVLYKQKISVDQDHYIGEVRIIENQQQLEEVVITTKKKLIERKVDRLVYNVENSITSQGMNGSDVLRNTPMLRVDDKEGISIIGKSGVSVMINDKMLHLSGTELSNYLQSIKSDDIAKIEVITTPPAKYEAQGNSGIINIILKANTKVGWSGTISSTIQKNTIVGTQNDLTINYKSDKINNTVNLFKYKNGFSPVGTRDLITDIGNQIMTEENRIDISSNDGVSVNSEYKINKRSNVSMMFEYYKSHYDMDADSQSLYSNLNSTSYQLMTNSQQRWKTPSLTIGLFYDVALDTLGKKLSLSGNISKSNSSRNNTFSTFSTENKLSNNVLTTSDMNYGIYSGQIDFTLPFKTGTIETGAKYTRLNNESGIGYFDYTNQMYIKDGKKSNELNYTEDNSALYFSAQKQFNDKWSTKVGLRYEYTNTNGTNLNSLVLNNKYGNLFPTFYLSFNPNENHNFSTNFSTRINRPSLNSMNPSRWYSNPYMYYEGNINLQPSISYNTELSYTSKTKLTFTLYNQYIVNENTSIAQLDGDIYKNTYKNGYNQNNSGLTISYYNTFLSIWEMTISGSAFYTIATPIIPELVSLRQRSATYNINNTINLNKAKTISYSLNFFHNLPNLYGTTYLKDIYGLSSGIRMSFLDKNLKFNLNVSDIFRSIKSDGYTQYAGYRENITQYNDYRKVSFGCTYSFGNKKVKEVTQSRTFEENNRKN